MKMFLILSFLLLPCALIAKAPKKNKSTTYSLCTRGEAKVIIAMETLRESDCQKMGKAKAEQYAKAGWSCIGRNNEELYSCEAETASTFATFKGVYLDNLTFTNLHKHRSLVAYINPNSNQLCHEDQAEITSSGVKDAICHKRR